MPSERKMTEIAYESETEFLIEKSRRSYLSLINLFVLTSLLFTTILTFNLYNKFFIYLLFITLLLQGIILLSYFNKRKINDFYIFVSLIPIFLIAPLFLLTTKKFDEIVQLNIILALFSIFFLFSFSLKNKYNLILQIIFLSEYLIVAVIHQSMTLSVYFESGGFLLNLLIISLSFSRLQNQSGENKLRLCRESVSRYKESKKKFDDGDPILGIFSKSGGMKVLKQMMKWSERYKIPLTVCYVELNDSHDDYVNTITRGIITRIRETDTLFRLGKQEMLLILPDCEIKNAADVMNYIQDKLKTKIKEKCLKFGLADFKTSLANSPNELIINANRASSTV